MRTTHGAAWTILLTALVAGCASGTDPGGATTAAPTTPTAGSSPSASDAAEVPSVAETSFPGLPDGVTGQEATVVAGDDPRTLEVVTFGSSTCPVLPTDVAWDADAQTVRITLSDPGAYAGVCTADMAPTTSVVALPDDAPDATGLTVELDGRNMVVG